MRKIFPTDFIMTPSDKPEMHGAVFTIWGGNRFTENNQTRFRRCRDTCRLVLIAIPDKPCIKCCCNNERLNKCRFGSCDMSRIIKFCLPLSIERERKKEREREKESLRVYNTCPARKTRAFFRRVSPRSLLFSDFIAALPAHGCTVYRVSFAPSKDKAAA